MKLFLSIFAFALSFVYASESEDPRFTRNCSLMISALVAADRIDESTARYLREAGKGESKKVAVSLAISRFSPVSEAEFLGHYSDEGALTLQEGTEFPVVAGRFSNEVNGAHYAGVSRQKLIEAMLINPRLVFAERIRGDTSTLISRLKWLNKPSILVPGTIAEASAETMLRNRSSTKTNWFKEFMEKGEYGLPDENPILISGIYLEPGERTKENFDSPLNRLSTKDGSRIQRAAFGRRYDPRRGVFVHYFSLRGSAEALRSYFELLGNHGYLQKIFLSNHPELKFRGPSVKMPMPRGSGPHDLADFAWRFGAPDQIALQKRPRGFQAKINIYEVPLPLVNAFMRSLSVSGVEIGTATSMEHAWIDSPLEDVTATQSGGSKP